MKPHIFLFALLLSFSTPLFAATQTDYELYLKSGDRSPKWNDLVESGFESFDSGNLPTASIFLERAYNAGCRDALLLFRLGLFRESRGQYKEAAALLKLSAEKIAKQYPSHPLAKGIHEHLGRELFQSNDFDGALSEFKKALEYSPDNFMMLFMSGQILRSKKETDAAKIMFEKALQAKPPAGIPYNPQLKVVSELMAIAFEQKDFDTCLLYADKILSVSPQDATALSYKKKSQEAKLKQREREVIEKIVK